MPLPPIEHRWNDKDRKLKDMVGNLSQVYFVHCRSHMEWLGLNPVLC